MRNFLYLKFSLIYLLFGYLIILISSTFTSQKINEYLLEESIDDLYQAAYILIDDSINEYFIQTLSGETVADTNNARKHLSDLQKHLDASIWLTDDIGNLLLYSKSSYEITPPSNISNFNPVESGAKIYVKGQYHNYLQNESISVMVPITQGYNITGYLLVHKSIDEILNAKSLILKIVDITLLLVFLVSFIILLGIHFIIYRPIHKITYAAKQYAIGDLNHEINIKSIDELGYLSDSLNHMSQQIRSTNDYQKQFIGNVSHDFRSPLTSIAGYIHAMSDGTIPPELHSKYYDIIIYETNRLTNLTKDLLLLNELGSTELSLDKIAFDFNEMLRQVALTFEGICQSKEILIILELSNNTTDVFADHHKIQQVLYNLLDNAIKFSPNKSKIIIETTDSGDKITVDIKDNGCGISSENIGKVFERFFKTDTSRGRDKKGTGLGLSIVKEIMLAHNESIELTSIPDVETVFSFTLAKHNHKY